MNEYRHSPRKRPPQYGSIDGFVRPNRLGPRPAAPHPVRLERPTPPPQAPQAVLPPRPLQVASNPLPQSPSLLNTTIPDLKSAGFKSRRKPLKKGINFKKLTKKRAIVSSILVIVILFLGIGGWLGARGLATLDKVFHGNIFSDISAAFNDTPLNGESSGRVNILLAGDSADQIGHGGQDLTDSILVLSINTRSHSAMLLSIPRDLWVDIPGFGWQKINAANDDQGTNFPGYPQNGMGQLQHLVTTDLGIPIDYYAVSDYGAFEAAVDAVGGVTVDIQSPDPRGLYDPNTDLNLKNGPVFLNGKEALNLARARGDGYGSYGFPDSDFDRTEHQRQLFTAIASKAKTLGVLANPVKVSDLFGAFGNNVQTDLSLQNVLRLVQITKGINLSSMQSYSYCSTLTIGQDGCTKAILTDYTDPVSGEEALVPTAGIGQYGQLQQYYQQLTSSNPIVKEAPDVVILNASTVVGLASEQRTILEGKGFNVAAVADANNEHPGTMIVDNVGTSKPNSLKLLQQLYPGSTVTSDTGSAEAEEAQGYTADFVVVLGQNWDGTTVTQTSQ